MTAAFKPIEDDRPHGARQGGGESRLRATRSRSSISIRSTSRSRATRKRSSICEDLRVVRLQAGAAVVPATRRRRGQRPANVVATLKGTVDPRSDLRREQPLRLGRGRPRRRRRHVGHGGAARDGAHAADIRCRRRWSSRRSPAKRPGCSAAASSSAARRQTSGRWSAR